MISISGRRLSVIALVTAGIVAVLLFALLITSCLAAPVATGAPGASIPASSAPPGSPAEAEATGLAEPFPSLAASGGDGASPLSNPSTLSSPGLEPGPTSNVSDPPTSAAPGPSIEIPPPIR